MTMYYSSFKGSTTGKHGPSISNWRKLELKAARARAKRKQLNKHRRNINK